ncbi:unnamed protein product [Lactuca virosa]|uniref:Uncharacterized protein n=1 Tax=Lactuca virosa TaxID=75947 RepID=A0AAU9LRW6_9ASTR|nr:unnamed protein product [Lactuca virosa]
MADFGYSCVEKVLSSFPFRNEAFITRAFVIPDVERRRVAAEPSRSASIDLMSLDIGVESSGNKLGDDEFVEDSKEGVLPLVNNRKAAWKNASEQNVDVLALVRRLCP